MLKELLLQTDCTHCWERDLSCSEPGGGRAGKPVQWSREVTTWLLVPTLYWFAAAATKVKDMAVAAIAWVEGIPYSAFALVSSLTTGGEQGRGHFRRSFETWPRYITTWRESRGRLADHRWGDSECVWFKERPKGGKVCGHTHGLCFFVWGTGVVEIPYCLLLLFQYPR